jgi:16S rRNA pseudouridine516 synthase
MKSRLDKVLAANGFGSRREIKRLLKNRALCVNGAVVTDPATVIDPEVDSLTLEGAPLELRTSVYLMMNKPSGVITSTDDPDHQTVIDLLDPPFSGMELFPIGRLDVDTEGLLVITNDGPLTHRLTSPKTGVDKTYYARLRDPVDAAAFAAYEKLFREGVTFRDGYTCLPARLARAGAEENGMFLTIQEGKYHQVKKMFRVVDNEVAYLKRVSMGVLALDPELAPGAYRELTDDEVSLLRDAVGMGAEDEEK